MMFYVLIIIIVLIIIGVIFVNFHPVFGEKSNGTSLERIEKSESFNGKIFENLIPTAVMLNKTENRTYEEGNFSPFSMISPPKDKNPNKPLSSVKFNESNVKDDSFIWFGHSTILMKTSNQTIMIDPVFNRASPIFIAGKPFEIENPINQEDLPQVNIIVITHDHYDHLDYKAIKKFGNNVQKYIVPLGVKAHLLRWGIEEKRIEELDWYENITYNDITFTLTPSRHFSGRSLFDRAKTLWGGYVIKSATQNVFISGDGGYSNEFEKIGKEYGPFDISFVENGQYNKAWAQIHMFPEESVQASIDLNSSLTMAIHWGKFDLAPHNWDEPIIRFTKEAKKRNVSFTTPLIGESFTTKNYTQNNWWEELRK